MARRQVQRETPKPRPSPRCDTRRPYNDHTRPRRRRTAAMTTATHDFVEEVELTGHIIDSLILPKVLDEILTGGGSYVIKDVQIGQRQSDPSRARIEVRAASAET